MFTKLRLVLSITIGILSFYGSAQTGYWQQEEATPGTRSPSLRRSDIKEARLFSLKPGMLYKELAEISGSKGIGKTIYFPDDSGALIPYKITEKSVMSPQLAAKYPGIRSYTGYCLRNKGDRIRFSVSHKGVQGMMVHADEKRTTFLEKTSGNSNTYVIYSRDSNWAEDSDFVCFTRSEIEGNKGASPARIIDDQQLRTYRIAVSASGEYTQFHGGTVADAMAAINATLTRVNEVFETDLAVTLELVADNDMVIFTDAATDPYDGNLNTQVQNTLSGTIGDANYDVGHLFHEDDDGGNAGFIGSVCKDNQKGSAYSSALNPQGDRYDLDFVAHELGHQFGANHTWSFESEGTLVQAEPASGTTIMGYAGIVEGNNVAPAGDDYFHYFSILQISQYLQTTSCGQSTALSNIPPVITPTGNFTIPKSTAFVLTGNATDADAGDILTYAWEQIDNGVVTTATFGPDRPSGASFRSQKPSMAPERYFPKLNEVILGNLTQTNPPVSSAWETVSNVERDLNFALTVRDNAPGGGQVVSDLVNIHVVNSSGPFVVTSQGSPETYTAGTSQTVQWDVANTDKAPVNAQQVSIYLSTDGGATFPVVLAQDIVNDGSHDVLIPGIATTQARIMVRASDNIFFAVNAAEFTIEESQVVLNFGTLSFDVCQPNDLIIPFTYETYVGFNEEVTFSALGAPAGLAIAFTPATAISGDTPVDLTVSNTAAVPVGNYPMTITATSASVTKDVDISLNIYDAAFSDVVLISPSDAATDVSLGQELTWTDDPGYTSYDLEIATDAGFGNVIESADVVTNAYFPANLGAETTYYWRVKPGNSCGEGTFGPAFVFTTIALNCKSTVAGELPLTISSTGTPTVTSTISFLNDLPVSDVNVTLDISHSFLSDLEISLISPAGTTVVLTSNSCGDLTDINAVFDHEASSFVCGGNPGISGTVKPLGSLASFNGESALGDWTLEIKDTAPADGGVLNAFSLEICVEGELRPDDDNDGVFDDGDDLCLNTPPGTEVDTDGCPVFRFSPDTFTIAIQSESCNTNNDGKIEITADQSLDYVAHLTGNGVDLTESFTDSFTFNNLMAGGYNLCISGTDGSNIYQQLCFEAVVNQPESLNVSSEITGNGLQAVLSLSGSDFYNIELNGVLMQIETSEIILNLKDGVNSLKVFTNLPCQGSYDKQIFVSGQPIIYPNPFSDGPSVFLGREMSRVEVTIHAANGRLLRRKIHNVNGNELRLDFIGLPTGMYFVSIQGEGITGSYKVVKR